MYLIRERFFRLGEASDISRRARLRAAQSGQTSQGGARASLKEEATFSTYRHIRIAVPWVLANATPAEEADLRATAPRLLGVVQDRVWEPRFARLMAPLYQQS